ncbi:MAG TPA: vanadium-dependent haloperoxidase [Kofleriaceae bacterium]|nr:vanadium-dependent haloperoxidase [Kofleriaceae bacterium]
MSHVLRAALAVLVALAAPAPVRADSLNEWNAKAAEILAATKVPPPPALRTMAIVQTAVLEAVNAITGRYPAQRARLKGAPGASPKASPGASIDAAIAAANRAVLAALVTGQADAIEAAYRAALATIPDSAARTAGIALGEAAAADVLAQRSDDGTSAPEGYRPRTTPGVYVPTTIPAATQWPQRRPWAMARPDQYRPGPPPELRSPRWAKDYNEIKVLGARNSATRTAAQTAVARFWEMTGPAIYFPLVRSVTGAAGRDVTQNARLLAMVAQALDDAAIAVFDAKYHHSFWRPITAIRNGDLDGNDATDPEVGWQPLIETPMHPEYPCAHCTFASTIGAVLAAEVGRAPMPRLTTTSATAGGAVHTWNTVDEMVAEVSSARIWAGVHYRASTEAGAELGKNVGAEVARQFLAAPHK